MANPLNTYFDHTVLKPEADETAITKLCEEAAKYQFAAVCINPCWVALAADRLRNTDVEVCTVVGFPLGASTSASKAFEASDAIARGATEIDMVMNIGAVKSGRMDEVQQDIMEVKRACGSDVPLKLIIEGALLSDAEIRSSCEVAVAAGADYVKTSTGMNAAGGATIAMVQLMKSVVGDRAKIKAAGGIRTREAVEKYIAAGASRIGSSSSVAIVGG